MRVSFLTVAFLLGLAAVADGMALRVAPVLLSATAPANVVQLNLRNDQVKPIAVQLRIFRWSQSGGVEKLEPTDDVVVSPPMMLLKNDEDYVARVVRVSKRPVVGEESFRLIVDEIPDMARRLSGTVVFALRQSIPVFFTAPDARSLMMSWSMQRERGAYVISARNDGERRIRVSNVAIKSASGAILTRQQGLVGYALGRSEMRWRVPASIDLAKAAHLVIESESGSIHATFANGAR